MRHFSLWFDSVQKEKCIIIISLKSPCWSWLLMNLKNNSNNFSAKSHHPQTDPAHIYCWNYPVYFQRRHQKIWLLHIRYLETQLCNRFVKRVAEVFVVALASRLLKCGMQFWDLKLWGNKSIQCNKTNLTKGPTILTFTTDSS